MEVVGYWATISWVLLLAWSLCLLNLAPWLLPSLDSKFFEDNLLSFKDVITNDLLPAGVIYGLPWIYKFWILYISIKGMPGGLLYFPTPILLLTNDFMFVLSNKDGPTWLVVNEDLPDSDIIFVVLLGLLILWFDSSYLCIYIIALASN